MQNGCKYDWRNFSLYNTALKTHQPHEHVLYPTFVWLAFHQNLLWWIKANIFYWIKFGFQYTCETMCALDCSWEMLCRCSVRPLSGRTRDFSHPLNNQIPLSSPLCLLKYSGFQQSADKCNACGHLIMDMVSVCYLSPVVCLYVWVWARLLHCK